jgi:hypothetical protein
MEDAEGRRAQTVQIGREIVYARLALGLGGDARTEFEEIDQITVAALAEDPEAAEQFAAIAGNAIAAVLVYENTLATTNMARRFGRATARGVWEALTLSTPREQVDGTELLAAIEGFGRTLTANDSLAPDATQREDYHHLGQRIVTAYMDRDAANEGIPLQGTPLHEVPDPEQTAAGDVIGAVLLFVGSLLDQDTARTFGRTAARGIRDALGIFVSPGDSALAGHNETALEGFAGGLASWVVGGFTSVTTGQRHDVD